LEHFERFGLARDPFRNEPQLEFWFGASPHVAAGRRLRRCIEQGKELCVLLGPIGSGTTTVARALFEQLDPERFELALWVPLRGVGADELRSSLARQLGVEAPAAERTASVRQLFAHLVALHQEGRHAVVGIDEAHTLAAEALAELRMLLNLEHEDRRLLSIVLIGSPALAAALEHDPGLAGRVELQATLEPLAPDEAQAYLAHRLETAGGAPTLLDAGVARAIATRAQGLPRRLNALADATLFEAHLADHGQPTLEDVERAARGLPWAHAGNGAACSAAEQERAALEDAASAPVLELTEAAPDDEPLEASFDAPPAVESLRDADSGSFAELEFAGLDGEVGDDDVGRDVERALGGEEGESADSIDADLIGPEETSPGAWQSPRPLPAHDALDDVALADDDDATASRRPVVRTSEPASGHRPLLPSEDELDNLFVDLLEESEKE
jgi:MSHA biogenesis protein MshM